MQIERQKYTNQFPTAEHKTDTASVQEMHTTIRAVSTELGDKVAEIQKQDRLVRDLQIQQASLDVITSNQLYLFLIGIAR